MYDHGPSSEDAAMPPARPVVCIGIEDDVFQKTMMMMANATAFDPIDQERSCVVGVEALDDDAFLDLAHGRRLGRDLRPAPPPHRQADILTLDHDLGPDCPSGLEIAEQLDDAGFRRAGVVCICTAGGGHLDVGQIESSRGVDFVVPKGATVSISQDVLALLVKRRAEIA